MKRSRVTEPLIVVLVSLLVIEGALQLLALANPRIGLLLSPGISFTIPDPVLVKRPNPEIPEHDTRGFRNPVALEQADVVVIGDSQTYGTEVSWPNAWPTLLGESLGVPTYSMSLGGWGPAEYFLLADEAFDLKPRVVLIGLYAGNDFADAFNFVMGNDVPELRAGGPVDLTQLREIDDDRGPLKQGWAETRAIRVGSSKSWYSWWLDPIEANSKIYGLFRGLSRIGPAAEVNMKTDRVRDDFDKYARKVARLPLEYYFPFRIGESGTVFTPVTRQAVVDLNDPRVEEGLRITLAAIERLDARCSDSCKVVVLMIPTKEFAFSEAVAASEVERPNSYEAVVNSEAALWQRMLEGLDRLGIASIDARTALADAIRNDRNPYLADWDGHPRRLGNQLIADYVSAHPTIRAALRQARSPGGTM